MDHYKQDDGGLRCVFSLLVSCLSKSVTGATMKKLFFIWNWFRIPLLSLVGGADRQKITVSGSSIEV